MIYGLIAEFRREFRLAKPFFNWIGKAIFHRKSLDNVVEFFTEAAVLIFVFPVLDTIVQFGVRQVTLTLAGWSMAGAVLSLCIAGILSTIGKE